MYHEENMLLLLFLTYKILKINILFPAVMIKSIKYSHLIKKFKKNLCIFECHLCNWEYVPLVISIYILPLYFMIIDDP